MGGVDNDNEVDIDGVGGGWCSLHITEQNTGPQLLSGQLEPQTSPTNQSGLNTTNTYYLTAGGSEDFYFPYGPHPLLLYY